MELTLEQKQALAIAEAKLRLKQKAPPQNAAPQVGVGEDMLRGGAAGVAQGAIGMPGMFGDAAQLNSDLLSGGAKYLGAPQWVQDAAGKTGRALMGPLGFMPTSEQITKVVTDATRPAPKLSGLVTGEQPKSFLEYEAKTPLGKGAQTVGQFTVPTLLSPGAVVPKALTGLGAAVGSEVAGQATEGTPWETPARIGAGLLSAVVTHKGVDKAMYKDNPVRTTAQIKDAGTKAYREADKIGLALKPQTTNYFIDKLYTAAGKAGFFPDNHTKLANALKAAEKWRDGPITLDQIDGIRKNIKTAYTFGDKEQNRVMREVVDELDNYIANMPASAVQSGNPKLVTSVLDTARKEWSTFKKSERLDEIFQNALNKEGANFSQASVTASIRQQLASLAKDNFKKAKYFSPEERRLILETIQGGKMENFLKGWGKYGIKSPLGVGASAMVGGGLSAVPVIGPVLGPAIGATLLGGGTVARPIARQMGVKSVENLSKVIRNRGPVGRTNRLLGSPAGRARLPIGVGAGLLGPQIPQLSNR